MYRVLQLNSSMLISVSWDGNLSTPSCQDTMMPNLCPDEHGPPSTKQGSHNHYYRSNHSGYPSAYHQASLPYNRYKSLCLLCSVCCGSISRSNHDARCCHKSCKKQPVPEVCHRHSPLFRSRRDSLRPGLSEYFSLSHWVENLIRVWFLHQKIMTKVISRCVLGYTNKTSDDHAAYVLSCCTYVIRNGNVVGP